MKHKEKTKDQLIGELEKLRRRIAELEKTETERKRAEETLKKSEERYRNLFELAPDAIITFDMKGFITSCNDAATRKSGYSKDELVGKHFTKIGVLRKKDIPKYLKVFTSLLRGKKPSSFEFLFNHKDGAIKYAEAHVSLLKVDGRTAGMLAILNDITDRKQAEEIIRESEEKFRNIYESVAEGLIYLDRTGRIIDVNEQAVKIYGGSKEEVLGKHFTKLGVISHKDIPQIVKGFKRILTGNKPTIFIKIKNKKGQEIDLECSGAVIKRDNRPAYVNVITRDITKYKKAEEALKKSEERYRNLVELAPDGILIADMKGIITSCNNAIVRLSGYSIDELVGKHFTKIGALRKKEIPRYLKTFNSLLRGKMPPPFEFLFHHKDGTIKWAEAHVSLLKVDGKKAGILAILRDITERRWAEEALQESEEKYRTLVENANDAIAIIQDRLLKYVNHRLAEITSYTVEELIGTDFANYVPLDELAKVADYYNRRMAGEDVPSVYESAIKHKDGHKILVEFNANITNYQGKPADLVVVRDITERKMTEEQIKIHQEKLRSLASRLSLAEEEERRRIAGMLHDNLAQKLALAKVKLGALREPLSAPDLIKSLDEIRELIQETIQDTSSLTFELSPPILYELGLTAAMEWLTEQIQDKYDIQIDFEDHGQPTPLGNDIRVVLFQAARELLTNAAKHSQANKVKISSRRDGKKIRIRVEDDGIGFKASEMQPHFAKTGGFGLFNIYERLEQFGGHMKIESTPGCGTRVTLVIPLEGGEKISKQK